MSILFLLTMAYEPTRQVFQSIWTGIKQDAEIQKEDPEEEEHAATVMAHSRNWLGLRSWYGSAMTSFTDTDDEAHLPSFLFLCGCKTVGSSLDIMLCAGGRKEDGSEVKQNERIGGLSPGLDKARKSSRREGVEGQKECHCEGDECCSEGGRCLAAGTYMMNLWKERRAFGSASSPQNFKSYFSSTNSDISLMFRSASIRTMFQSLDSTRGSFGNGGFPMIPRIHISADGTLRVILSHEILVDLSLTGSVRLWQTGTSASVSGDESLAGIHHPGGDFLLDHGFMYANFSRGTRLRLLPDGIRYRPHIPSHPEAGQKNWNNCYWNLNDQGLFWEEIRAEDTSLDPFGEFHPRDQSVSVFFSDFSEQWTDDYRIFNLISRARVFPNFSKHTITTEIGNMIIKQDLQNGSTQVQKDKAFLSLRPTNNRVTLQTQEAKMTIAWDRVCLENGSNQKIQASSTSLRAHHGPDKTATFDLCGRLRFVQGFHAPPETH